MYLNYKDKIQDYWILDLEANGFDPTVIHCVVCKNLGSEEVLEFLNKEDFNAWYKPTYIVVGHHVLGYDAPVLNRLWDSKIPLSSCLDTLVLSFLYNPALEDGHSLEAWGKRLKFPKTDWNEWDKFSPQMLEYCRNDVELTFRLYKALTERMRGIGFSELSCEIEHKIRVIINEQQSNGFYFNKMGANDFRQYLRREQSRLSDQIQKLFPPVEKLIKRCEFRRNKDGSLPARIETARNNYYRVDLHEDLGAYACFELEEFNLGSPKQRVERLLELGWIPEKFSKVKSEKYPSGFPKVDEDALVKFAEQSGREEVRALAEWLVIQGRASMLDTWFNNLGEDSRIHGRVNSCGATTRRMIHSAPNSANIPSGAKAKYGHECRSFWGVEPGKGLVLVGYDAAGLETAGLCHYLNNNKATEILLRPKPDDIHTANAGRLSEALGWACDREWAAKTSWYAWLYGAYPPKLGSIVGANKNGMSEEKAGDIVVDTFFRNVPGLKKLIEDIQLEFKSNRGRLETIDGGYVLCPSLNAALNYRIQSLGSIVMKLSSILLREEADKIGLFFKKVGDIHDESQLEVEEQYAEQLGNLAVWSIEEASRQLKMNVLVTGDFKVGLTWAETH